MRNIDATRQGMDIVVTKLLRFVEALSTGKNHVSDVEELTLQRTERSGRPVKE